MAVSDYDPIIEEAAHEWNVDPNLLRAHMQQESGGNATDKYGRPITSTAGAGGLMQIMPGTARGLGVGDVHDPAQAIFGAAKLINENLQRYPGRPDLAVAAYNANPRTVDEYAAGRAALPRETQAYVPAVAAHYARFAKTATPAAQPAAGVPSDDEFLKGIGAPSGGAAVPSDEDFLKAIPNQSPAPSKTPVAPTIPATSDDPVAAYSGAAPPGSDEYGNPLSPRTGPAPSAEPNPLANIGSAVVQGAKAGFGSSPLGLSDQSVNALRQGGVFANPATGQGGPLRAVNEAVIRPLAAGADLALRTGAGILRGAQAGVTALGDALPEGPTFTANSATPFGRYLDESATALLSPRGAARTIAALPEAFPAGLGNARPPEAPAPVNPLSNWQPAEVPFLSQEFRANPGVLTPQTTLKAPVSPVGVNPFVEPGDLGAVRPGMGGPLGSPQGPGMGPAGSVGAAGTPSNVSNMSPREVAASRATGEMQRVLAPAQPGIDTRIYVPGTKPTEAEVSGNPSVAFDQKLNRQQNPDAHLAQERANNEARVEYFEQAAGTPTQVNRLVEARGDQAKKDLSAAFGNKSPTDATPVADTIQGILTDPRLGERDLIQKYISPIAEKLKKADGSLKDDPENLYGIRENVNDLLSKAGKASDPAVGQVEPQLMTIKKALDQVIEAGAPGYRQYLQNYADASKPIDAMNYLQDARPKLTNAQGTMTPAAFDRFMKNTVSDRAAGGVNPAIHLTEDQMDVLHNIHSDLKRSQNINLSNPRGSDTSMLTEGVKKSAELAAHAGANLISPVLGSIGVQMGKNALQRRAVNKMTDRVLNPNPLRYPPPSAP